MEHLFNHTPCLSPKEVASYLNGEMDAADRSRVENHLLDCDLCTTAVEGYAEVDGLNQADLSFLETYNKTLDEKMEPKLDEAIVRTLEPRPTRFLFSRIAAAVLILMIPFSTYMYWSNTQSDRLYGQYFASMDVNNEFRGLEEMASLDTDLKNALDNYKQRQYEACIPQFEAYLERTPENSEAILYAGIASLETGYYQKADDFLTTVRINSERFFQDATWYLVLTKVKSSQKDEAVDLLEDLLKKNDAGFYAEKARALLKELRK